MMYVFDTNYLIHLILREDQIKLTKIYDFLESLNLEKEKVYIPLVSLFECFWVLKSLYRLPEKVVINSLEEIFVSGIFVFENQEIFLKAVEFAKGNDLGIEDNYVLAYSKINNLKLITFDKKLSKLA